MMELDRGEMSGGGWIVMIVLMLLVVTGLFVLGFALFRGTPRAPQSAAPAAQPLNPLEILEQRLARGDIDPEDYERRRLLLTRGSIGQYPPGS